MLNIVNKLNSALKRYVEYGVPPERLACLDNLSQALEKVKNELNAKQVQQTTLTHTGTTQKLFETLNVSEHKSIPTPEIKSREPILVTPSNENEAVKMDIKKDNREEQKPDQKDETKIERRKI